MSPQQPTSSDISSNQSLDGQSPLLTPQLDSSSHMDQVNNLDTSKNSGKLPATGNTNQFSILQRRKYRRSIVINLANMGDLEQANPEQAQDQEDKNSI